MSGKIIQIVEDEALTALDIEEMLIELGYKVSLSVDTAEAAVLGVQSNRPDLVLMDIKLKGGGDGISAAQKIWNDFGIPIIFITSYSDEVTLGRAKFAHPFGYILKPFRKVDLAVELEFAFHRHATTVAPVMQVELAEESFELEVPIELNEVAKAAYDFLRRVEPFRKLNDVALKEMAEKSFFRTFKSGHQLIREGDVDASSFIVATGRLSCIKGSVSGKELVVTLIGPGDPYALFVALEDEPFPFTVRVERESIILFTPTDLVRRIFADNVELYQGMCEAIFERIRESDELARQLAHDKVEVRIAGALFTLMGRFGKLNRIEKRCQIQLTRQELANLVGTTPETAIRVTKAMESQGILDLTKPGRIVVIDSELLRDRIDG